MIGKEAIEEAKRRWPTSEGHNAYETRTRDLHITGRLIEEHLYHVVAYLPHHAGSGDSYEAAFEHAERQEKKG